MRNIFLVSSVVGAFCVGGRPATAFLSSPSRLGGTRDGPRLSSPGGWENDNFLESLGGEGGAGDDPADEDAGDRAPAPPVPHAMTDEEITRMATRAAQFYNTDASMEEAYGVPREGPPRKAAEEEEGGGEFQ